MPAILIRILSWLMTSLAGQVLFSLGLGVLSFASINSLMGWLTERMTTYFMGAPKNILIFVQLLEIDYYFSALLSAFIIKSTIMAAQVALAKRT